MSEPMTPERRTEIATRHAAATRGIWRYDPHYGPLFLIAEYHGYGHGIGDLASFGEGEQADRDREFVLNSYADVGDLLAEVERLRSACADPDFTCLTGEYCAGCEKADHDRAERELELSSLHEEVSKLRLMLGLP